MRSDVSRFWGWVDDRQAPSRPERCRQRPILGGRGSPRVDAASLRPLWPGVLPAPAVLPRLLGSRNWLGHSCCWPIPSMTTRRTSARASIRPNSETLRNLYARSTLTTLNTRCMSRWTRTVGLRRKSRIGRVRLSLLRAIRICAQTVSRTAVRGHNSICGCSFSMLRRSRLASRPWGMSGSGSASLAA